VKKMKHLIAFMLIVMMIVPFSTFAANASTYYDLVTDSKASENFNDDKVNAGIDKTQKRSTEYNEYRQYNIVDEQTVIVTATQHTTYTAKVPAILIVDGAFKPNGTNNFSFQVSVEGNLAGDALVKLQPDNSFTLSSYGKEDIPASISQEKTKFTYADGVRIDNPVVSSGTGKVQNMTAGLWYGTWNYNIRFLPIVDYDCYTWADDDYTTGQITGITEIGKDKLETFGIMLFPEPNEADNYEGVTSISSDVSTLMREIERTDCDIVIPNTVERIEDSTLGNSPFGFAKANKIIFEKPSKIKYLGTYAFSCANIKEPIEIPSSVEEIAMHALSEINGYLMNVQTAVTFTFEEPSNLKTIGKEAFRYCNVTGKLVLPDGLKTIEESAFAYCAYTEIVLPDTVETIGRTAFERRLVNGTSPIIKLNFPSSLVNWDEAFEYSTIQTITLPSNLTAIPKNSFRGCTSLSSINIPSSVTRIGEYAFSNTALSSVTLPNNLEFLGSSSFGNTKLTSFVVPDSVNEIGGFCYSGESSPVYNCKKLTSITLGRNTPLEKFNFKELENLTLVNIHGTKSISENAFRQCKKLETINIDPGVEYIEKGAFLVGSVLKKVNFNGSLEQWLNIELEDYTSDPTYSVKTLYLNNQAVKGITIPASVGIVGGKFSQVGRSFNWNTLTSVVIENGVTKIDSSAFSGCANLSYISIPESVVSIGSSAFEGCSSLAAINLPSGLTEIANYAFSKTSLKQITIPNGVTNIGEQAFSSNTKLLTVNMPDSLKSIGKYAFAGCTAINDLTIPNSVETIGSYAFNDYKKTISIDNVEGSISGSPWGGLSTKIVWLREAE